MTKPKEKLWELEIEAHRIHHKIADYILHKDLRDQPAPLKLLLKKYRLMMNKVE